MPEYAPETLDHFRAPRNVGVLADADGKGTAGKPGEGHFVVVYIKVEEGRIMNASFQTFGCPAAIACGSYVTEHVRGQTTEEAFSLSEKEVLAGLGGLPLGKRKNAGLALAGLHAAIEDFRGRRASKGDRPNPGLQSG